MEPGDAAAQEVTCQKCGYGPYTPSMVFDFYPTGEDPTQGDCERCVLQALSAKVLASKEPVPVPPEHLDNICKLGQGEAVCAFVGAGADGFSCMKGSAVDATIRQRIASGSMNAKGDNCSGPPEFTPTTR